MEFRGRRDASREKEDGAIPMRKVQLIFCCCCCCCWCDHFLGLGFPMEVALYTFIRRLSITR